MSAQQVNESAQIIRSVPEGAYTRLTLAAPRIAAIAQPGQFVTTTVGGPVSAHLLRRALSIAEARPGEIDLVVSPVGAGTQWLTQQPVGTPLSLLGPAGQGFTLPATDSGPALLVAGGYGAGPLVWWSEHLQQRGDEVIFLVGAATLAKLPHCHVPEGVKLRYATDDGSSGHAGFVTELLDAQLRQRGQATIYACGPMPMLAAVSQLGQQYGSPTQCAVEELMACGYGVCMSCVLPVKAAAGVPATSELVRACTNGPVFDGSQVLWDEVGTVPATCLGSPQWQQEQVRV